ncbi:MAG: NAD-dependent epimerase/dehydratase family protein [Flavobacteriales bacterium]
MKKALVIGATGLVGKQLVKQLLDDSGFSEVVCFVRRHSGVAHPRLTEHLVDFKSPDSWSQLIAGDVRAALHTRSQKVQANNGCDRG